METEPTFNTALALARRLGDQDMDLRRLLDHVVSTLGAARAHALADQVLAIEAGGGMIRAHDGLRVRFTPSGVFLTLAREAGWRGADGKLAPRYVRTAAPSRLPAPSARPLPPSTTPSTLPRGQHYLTVKVTEPPKQIATTDDGSEVYALDVAGRVVSFTLLPTLRPKAQARFAEITTAAHGTLLIISGQIGRPTPGGFELDNATVQLIAPGQRTFAKDREPNIGRTPA